MVTDAITLDNCASLRRCTMSTAGEQYANNSNPNPDYNISSCSRHLLQCNMEEHLAFVDWKEQDTLRVVVVDHHHISDEQ